MSSTRPVPHSRITDASSPRTSSIVRTTPSSPPVANPSAQINQLNQSFPLNGGLGLNPTNRDAYIRYNLTR